MAINENKQKALDVAMAAIEQQFGKGSIMRLGDGYNQEIEAISSGSLNLDIALGIGGYAKGRIIEIYGPESAGKTTLTLHAIAECQKSGGTAAFIDAEHALDPIYAESLGINLAELIISQPDNGEQALEILEKLVRSNAVDLVVVDSVAALTPKAEINGDMGDSHMGLQARLMSQGLRKITGAVKDSNTIVYFVNQLRMKIGVMFGSPETTTGGNALKFYASQRLDIRKKTPIKDGDVIIGNETKVKVVKNKVGPPFKEATFDIIYGKGISKVGEILALSVEYNLIEKAGSWYSLDGEKIGQGKEKTKDYLENNQEVADFLEKSIREKIKKIKDDKKNEAQAKRNESMTKKTDESSKKVKSKKTKEEQ
jgi:recombination protein RecA